MNTYSGVWRCIQRLHQIYPFEVETIFKRIGLAKSLLGNQEVSLPVEILLKFVMDAESVFDDELVSINFGRMAQVRPNYGEAFGLAFVYSKNLEEAITLLQSFIGTELEGIAFLISEEDNLIKIQSVADPTIKNPSINENIGLDHGRLHECYGPAKLLFPFFLAQRCKGPILWIRPSYSKHTINPNGVSKWVNPHRFIFINSPSFKNTLWCIEESLRIGTCLLYTSPSPRD